jgi:hypothetical protein
MVGQGKARWLCQRIKSPILRIFFAFTTEELDRLECFGRFVSAFSRLTTRSSPPGIL